MGKYYIDDMMKLPTYRAIGSSPLASFAFGCFAKLYWRINAEKDTPWLTKVPVQILREAAIKFKLYPDATRDSAAWGRFGFTEFDAKKKVLEIIDVYGNTPDSEKHNILSAAQGQLGIIAFMASGKNIFDFSPALTHLLSHTDIPDAVSVPEIIESLPYIGFYIAYSNSDIHEGAYYLGGTLVVMETVKDMQGNDALTIYLSSDLRPRLKDNSRSDCLQTASMTLIHNQTSLQTLYEELTARARAEWAVKTKMRVRIMRTMRLVLNALCWLASADKDVVREHPPELKGIVERARHGNKKQKATAQAELKARNYTTVAYCGRKLHREYLAKGIDFAKEMPSHWRRGHWRNQAIGEGWKGHKHIWIHPTVVRKDKGEPPRGHVYKIQEAPANG